MFRDSPAAPPEIKIPSTPTFPTEGNGAEIKYTHMPFRNWGGTVTSTPAYTFYPKTKVGISNIVTWAKSLGKQVRVAGYKHTWTHFFADDNEILIALKAKEGLITPSALDRKNELEHIELIGKEFVEEGQVKHLCKIGAATSNEQIRTWSVNSFLTDGNEHSWTLPLNVILVENTVGGTNALMCHGAGWHNKTLSDLVTEIEFVNANGKLQTIGYKITDPEDKQHEGRELIKSAAGAFGLLGPVTALTFKLNRMSHAEVRPVAPRLALAVPPPPDYVFPRELPEEIIRGITKEQFIQAQDEFILRCKEHYYSEFFWFSLNRENRAWVYSFNNDGSPAESKSYPSRVRTTIQEVQQFLAGVANKSLMQWLPPKVQALLLSEAAMLLLPTDEHRVMPLSDALHFRHGIDEMEVCDYELHIPIQALPNGEPDFSICQRAWWDAVATVYEFLEKGKVPMRLPLEMRIMGGSEMTMASQKGNTLGTCAIEILTPGAGLVGKAEWLEFMQAVTDKWASYTDASGKPLNVRPHWAKQSIGLTIERKGEPRKDMWAYIKESYQDAIPVFKKHLSIIADKGGYHVEDMKMFSNPLLNYLFYDGVKPKELEEKIDESEELTTPTLTLTSTPATPTALHPLPDISSVPKEVLEKEAMTHLFQLRDNACAAHAAAKKCFLRKPAPALPSPRGFFSAPADESKRSEKITDLEPVIEQTKKKSRFCCW